MPIYEYRRPDGSTFELIQSFSDEPLTHDPESGVDVQRVLHAPAVHFKGKGFYNTDYGTRKRQRESSSDSDAKSASSESSKDSGGATGAEAKDKDKKSETSSPASGADSKTSESRPAKDTRGSAAKSKPAKAA